MHKIFNPQKASIVFVQVIIAFPEMENVHIYTFWEKQPYFVL